MNVAELLAPAAVEPGTYTAEDLAKLAGWWADNARTEIVRLRRRGLVAPSRVRLTSRGSEVAAELDERTVGTSVYAQVLAALDQHGPMSVVALGAAVGQQGRSGALKRALALGEVSGLLTMPSGVVLTADGLRFVLCDRSGLCAVLKEAHFVEAVCRGRGSGEGVRV